MAKEVQLRGHEAEIANQLTGLARELTVDTDNWELRLHDGFKVGGYRILNRDQNDERYQRRSTELDGLLGWEPNEVGIVTRVGSGEYRLRTLTFNEANLVVEDGNGQDANPYISLAPEITSDHQWSGANSYSQPIEAEAGLVGNVTGDLTGDSTGFHTGDVLGDVEGNLTGNVTGNLLGGFDTRGSDIVMDDDSIDPDWIAGFGDALANAGIPVGSVVMWFGSPADVPANWRICDGSGGTPDLRDKFVVAAGVTYSFASSGGSATHDHALTTEASGDHEHEFSVGAHTLTSEEMPKHRHLNGVTDQGLNAIFCYGGAAAPAGDWDHVENSGSGVFQGYTSYTGGFGIDGETEAHTHPGTMEAGGAHIHAGGTGESDNIPPYFALYYIIKVS